MNQIRQILEDAGYSLTELPKEFRAKPLYRESNNNTSLRIDKFTGEWIDFSANLRGNLNELVKLTLGLKSMEDVNSWMKTRATSFVRPTLKPTIKQRKIFAIENLRALMPIHTYWIERGISMETLTTFKGGLVANGKMADRYVFPIYGPQDKIYGFSGRTVKDKTPKWKHIGNKTEWRYPFYFNRWLVFEKKALIIVESIGDMLALWDSDIKNTFVCFGLSLSGVQVKSLLKFNLDKIVISLNNDSDKPQNTGQIAAAKMSEMLYQFYDKEQIIIAPPTKKDFGEMTKEENRKWYESCSL